MTVRNNVCILYLLSKCQIYYRHSILFISNSTQILYYHLSGTFVSNWLKQTSYTHQCIAICQYLQYKIVNNVYLRHILNFLVRNTSNDRYIVYGISCVKKIDGVLSNSTNKLIYWYWRVLINLVSISRG